LIAAYVIFEMVNYVNIYIKFLEGGDLIEATNYINNNIILVLIHDCYNVRWILINNAGRVSRAACIQDYGYVATSLTHNVTT